MAKCGIKVGNRVVANDAIEGEVKYVGPLKYKGKVSPGIYIGMQLDEPNGRHSGELEVSETILQKRKLICSKMLNCRLNVCL